MQARDPRGEYTGSTWICQSQIVCDGLRSMALKVYTLPLTKEYKDNGPGQIICKNKQKVMCKDKWKQPIKEDFPNFLEIKAFLEYQPFTT